MSLNIYRTDKELDDEYQEAVISGRKNEKNVKAALFNGFCIFLVCITLFLGYFAYQIYSAHIRLNNGAKTAAILDNKYTQVRDRTGTRYSVSYTFKVNERSYSGEGSLAKEPTTKNTTVVYDLSDPNNNKLENGEDFFERIGKTIVFALILGVIANFFTFGLKSAGKFSFRKSANQKTPITNKSEFRPEPNETPKQSKGFQLSSNSILWIEKELLKLNNEMWGEDRPPHDLKFLQSFPKTLLEKENLTTDDVAKVTEIFVNEIRKKNNKLEVPFRKPRVEFTKLLLNNEPGHIEFGEYETVIRIHPNYTHNPFALASILCHEIAHFVLDQNGLKKDNTNENEKLTDLFIFVCGQGLIHLQGILDITSENGQATENRLGYLSIEEMAYAHVRSSAQHGLSTTEIAPDYFSGKVFEEVKKAIDFLKIKNDKSASLAEIILCPNDHILRISTERKSQLIRCPKCKWEKEIWLYKTDQINYTIEKGVKDYNSDNFISALESFRKVQTIDKTHSMAYCWASRCLKKQGQKQDAIRELQKLLSFRPHDQMAQDEMKTLIYN
jgi:tetratricopeptide (TPR) repeat protein